MRHRQIKQLALNHAADKWQNQDLNSDSLVLEPRFLTCLSKKILLALYVPIKGVRWKKILEEEKREKDEKQVHMVERGRMSLTTTL